MFQIKDKQNKPQFASIILYKEVDNQQGFTLDNIPIKGGTAIFTSNNTVNISFNASLPITTNKTILYALVSIDQSAKIGNQFKLIFPKDKQNKALNPILLANKNYYPLPSEYSLQETKDFIIEPGVIFSENEQIVAVNTKIDTCKKTIMKIYLKKNQNANNYKAYIYSILGFKIKEIFFQNRGLFWDRKKNGEYTFSGFYLLVVKGKNNYKK